MSNTWRTASMRVMLSTCAIGSVLALAPTADAQSADASSQEIVVTANRTSSLASKTPITLSAISGDSLTAAGITNPTQLASAMPGIMVERGNANGVQINIRGIQSTGGIPSVAFLSDGIYIANTQAQEVAFFDVNRVEALRGPQGTLYGRNTPAGVVNVISNEPTFHKSGSFDIGYGNYHNLHTTAVVNMPVSDTLALRLAANWETRDSFYKVLVPQANPTPLDKNNKSVRLSALYKPSDNFKALLRFDYTLMTGSGSSFGAFPLLSNFYQMPLPFPATGVRTASPTYLNPSASKALGLDYGNDYPASTSDASWGVSTELTWNISPAVTATYLGSYRVFTKTDSGTTYFGTQFIGATMNNLTQPISNDLTEKAQSHELRLAYDQGPLKAQVGGYYFNQNGKSLENFTFFVADNPWYYERSVGIFGQATYSLTDRWRVTGGVRYTKDNSGALTSGLYSGSKVTWKASTDFDLSHSVMAYATIASGYKSGSLNQNCAQITVSCAVKPEEITDFEAGIKGRFLDNKLTANAAVFHYNYTDLQISQVVPLLSNLGSTVATTNAAAAKVDGVELEGGYRVDARSKFDFSAAWLHARYTNFLIAPSVSTTDNFNGAPLDHAPKWTLSAGYTFTQPLKNGGELVANVHTRYVDRYVMISQVVNTLFVQPAFTKTDISLRYNAPGAKWYVEGFAHNLENTIDVNYVNTAPLFGSTLPWNNNGKASTGDPRTFGFRAGIKFQ